MKVYNYRTDRTGENNIMIELGMKAPEFTLPDENGNEISLSDFSGKKVVLFFYSKDMTAG